MNHHSSSKATNCKNDDHDDNDDNHENANSHRLINNSIMLLVMTLKNSNRGKINHHAGNKCEIVDNNNNCDNMGYSDNSIHAAEDSSE